MFARSHLRQPGLLRAATAERPRRLIASAATVALLSSVLIGVSAPAASAAPTTAHINFQPASAPVPAGYTADSGKAFDGTSGWQTTGGTPLDLTANTRDRNSSLSPSQLYDTIIHMQAPAGSGSTTPGVWQYALENGTYDVTVAVGEASATNSVNRIVAEPGGANAVTIIDNYVPTSSARWSTATRQVTVSDGFLTLDPTGGSNTKLDFVDIAPVIGSTPGSLAVSAPLDGLLGLSRSRLVFSTVQQAATPTQNLTFTNTGGNPVTVSNIAVGGTDAGSFSLAPGQPTTLTIAPGATATVGVRFTPGANSFCATNAGEISNLQRFATLTFSSDAANLATGTADLAGVNACGNEGANEPVLDQITSTLGYTTVTSNGSGSARRALGPLRPLPNSDQVQVPYFVRADTSKPVTLTPIAHYSGRTTYTFGQTGWFAKGAAVTTPCSSTCTQLFSFPADSAAPGPYNQNQKLMPTNTGSTTFTPTGAFGIYNGNGYDVNFTDDGLNVLHSTTNADVTPPHYGKGFRVFPAYGPDHVLIPNTWILATDVTRIPAYKNNDYQDVVFLLTNAAPEVGVATAPGSASLNRTLTAGGSVTGQCVVAGFDGVLPNSGGTQCNPGNISYTSSGLALTSTPGEMANGINSQQNALYNTFDASRSSFTVKARIAGPLPALTDNYQQIATFFGPDQNNYFKVEVEHNGNGTDPHLTVLYEQGGSATVVASVSVPALATANTVDLIINGNSSQPDGIQPNVDTYKVRGYPLDQVWGSYSINGGTPVMVGTKQLPKDPMGWFSTSAKAGILVSSGGSSTPITATFTRFAITTP
jgi:hypothetical protein